MEPTEAGVVVIGGGLLGSALTYYLAFDGVDTLLVERGEWSREASGAQRWQPPHPGHAAA